MLTKRFAFLALMFLTVSTCALAQKSEVAFVAGSTFSPGVTGHGVCGDAIPGCITPTTPTHFSIDQGFTFEGSYAYRLADFKLASVHLEVPLVFSPSRKANTFSQLNRDTFSTFFFTPSVKLKLLPASGVSPFLSAGGGMAHFVDGTTANTGAFQLGGGLDFKTHLPLLGFRVEARDFITGRPGTNSFGNVTSDHLQHIFVGGGITLHF